MPNAPYLNRSKPLKTPQKNMKKLLLGIFLLFTILIYSQEKLILISDQTVKIVMGEEKEFYFSFAENDEILFDFQMVKGKNLKELEFVELPSNTLFSEYKVTKFNNKSIKIRNKGLYKLRFYSSALSKRVIKFKIQRRPENKEKRNFNTNWKWKILRDTLYIPYTKDSITGYKKIKYKETVRELVKTELVEDLLFNKTQKVHSDLHGGGNLVTLRVDLPQNLNSEFKEEKIKLWSYWIGVGQEAQKAYQESTNSVKSLATKLTSAYASPLAGLAVGAITDLIVPKTGEDVGYSFIPNYENAKKYENNLQYLQFDTGKGIVAYGKKTNPLQGTFYIGLYNDNAIQPIDVNVKIVLIKEIKTYENKEYEREKEEPIIVKLNKKRMEIKETKIRIPVE